MCMSILDVFVYVEQVLKYHVPMHNHFHVYSIRDNPITMS